jgi:putative peptidoglycan lipid II flippase
LVRELFIASAFGASALTDAFNVAFRIPNLFRRLFAEGAFSQAFVPVLAASKAQNGDEATKKAIDHVATLLAWSLLLLSFAGVLAAPFLVWAMASGLQQQPESYEAAVHMTRWMFPYIGFMSMVALSAGILNTWKKFAVPAATPVLLNLAMIGAAWLLAPWLKSKGIQAIYALPVAVVRTRPECALPMPIRGRACAGASVLWWQWYGAVKWGWRRLTAWLSLYEKPTPTGASR